ncbi:MAG: hypothetical protein HUK21_02065 [Fibrobacteraceae bacterium]|nr:hypothetical protein [Fibrobacteraceae bacterium]
MYAKTKKKITEDIVKAVIHEPEVKSWDSGFSFFKRRIDQQLQLNGFDENTVDDDDLLPFYRNGESETYVLAALGCYM